MTQLETVLIAFLFVYNHGRKLKNTHINTLWSCCNTEQKTGPSSPVQTSVLKQMGSFQKKITVLVLDALRPISKPVRCEHLFRCTSSLNSCLGIFYPPVGPWFCLLPHWLSKHMDLPYLVVTMSHVLAWQHQWPWTSFSQSFQKLSCPNSCL